MKALLITTAILTLIAVYVLTSNYYARSYGSIYAEGLCFNDSIDNPVCQDYLNNEYLITKLMGAK